jgi:hypothetical protein
MSEDDEIHRQFEKYKEMQKSNWDYLAPEPIKEPKTPERLQLEATLKAIDKETSFAEIGEILEATIKKDDMVKQITFATYNLTYLGDNQTNICFKSESARGKSYIVLEIAKLFPKEDVVILHRVSRTAFFHRYGQPIYNMDELTASGKHPIDHFLVDLEKKIYIFVDQPGNEFLETMRPILSHDKKELESQITDKSKEGALRTQKIVIRGYPTTVYCTAKMLMDEQESTRMFILSPEATQEKLTESIRHVGDKEAYPVEYEKMLEDDPNLSWLKGRIQRIKEADIENVNIPDIETVWTKFRESHPWFEPRHQRDYSRLILLIKSSALLNFINRKRDPQEPKIINATEKDIEEGFRLYECIRQSNEMGLPPELYEIFTEIIEPLLDTKVSLSGESLGARNSEIIKAYYQNTKRVLSNKKLTEVILPQLEGAGLIILEKDSVDKRFTLVKKPLGEIYTPEGGRGEGVKSIE